MRNLVFWLALITCFSTSAYAHNTNKVVVIPMVGNPPPLEPITPVAPANPSSNNYTIYDDVVGQHTVIDNVTGLEWQREDDDVLRNWDAAYGYCDGLNNDSSFAGKTHWRLPDRTELLSIVDYGNSNPAIEGIAFIGTNSNYWSASTIAGLASRAWFINFSTGSVNNGSKTSVIAVRCVR